MKDIPENHEALKLPNPADIFNGKITKIPDGMSFSGQYAMVTALEYELRDRYSEKGHNTDFRNNAAIYLEFIHNNFPKELCAFSIRNVLKNLQVPVSKAPNWNKFAPEYVRLIMAA